MVLVLVAGAGAFVYAKWLRPMAVIGYEISPATLVVEVMGTGSVEARTSTIISSKISGRLVELGVDQGERVEAGATLARLDDGDLERQVEMAQATLEGARAGLDRFKAEEVRAQAVLRLAERENERTRLAFEQGASTEAEIDIAAGAVAVARADVARAEAGIAEGRKLVIGATKGLEYQQARLADTVIEAPYAGLIVRRDRDPGDIVAVGSSIYRLISTDEIWVSAWVDETAMSALAAGQRARVVLRSEADHPYPGHVVRLGRETDPETREFIVDVAMERLPEHWAIGQRGEAYIETQRLEGVLVAPLTYVFVVDGEQGMYVARNGRAAWRVCELGARGRERVEIRSGLERGDVVVRPADLKSRAKLGDGTKVAIE